MFPFDSIQAFFGVRQLRKTEYSNYKHDACRGLAKTKAGAGALLSVALNSREKIEDRTYAAAALARLKQACVAPILRSVADNKHNPSYLRREAAEALGHLPGSASAPTLLAILEDREQADQSLRNEAAAALRCVAEVAVVPRILSILGSETKYVAPKSSRDDYSSFVVLEALLLTLGDLRAPQSLETLLAHCEHPDNVVHKRALEAVGAFGDRTTMRRVLCSKIAYHTDVQRECLTKLGWDDPPSQLGELLLDRTIPERGRSQVITRLKELKYLPGCEQLLHLVKDRGDKKHLRMCAVRALVEISGQHCAKVLIRVFKAEAALLWDPKLKAQPGFVSDLLYSLAELRALEVVPDIVRLIDHPHKNIFEEALRALAKMGQREALVAATKHKQRKVAEEAVRMLDYYLHWRPETDEEREIVEKLFPKPKPRSSADIRIGMTAGEVRSLLGEPHGTASAADIFGAASITGGNGWESRRQDEFWNYKLPDATLNLKLVAGVVQKVDRIPKQG